jgi:hypothetical protein
MAIDEARDRQTPMEIDDVRPRTDPLLDVGVAPHRRDPVAAHRDRLGTRVLRVDGEEIAVHEDEIRAGLLRAHGAGGGERDYEAKESKFEHWVTIGWRTRL